MVQRICAVTVVYIIGRALGRLNLHSKLLCRAATRLYRRPQGNLLRRHGKREEYDDQHCGAVE